MIPEFFSWIPIKSVLYELKPVFKIASIENAITSFYHSVETFITLGFSEYPEPITFIKGASLTVTKKYEGPENWGNWLFCETPGQKGGWVPAQIIEIIKGNTARAREDYTARELDVQVGDLLLGLKTLNGWVWCKKHHGGESGWVPLANLKEVSP